MLGEVEINLLIRITLIDTIDTPKRETAASQLLSIWSLLESFQHLIEVNWPKKYSLSICCCYVPETPKSERNKSSLQEVLHSFLHAQAQNNRIRIFPMQFDEEKDERLRKTRLESREE